MLPSLSLVGCVKVKWVTNMMRIIAFDDSISLAYFFVFFSPVFPASLSGEISLPLNNEPCKGRPPACRSEPLYRGVLFDRSHCPQQPATDRDNLGPPSPSCSHSLLLQFVSPCALRSWGETIMAMHGVVCSGQLEHGLSWAGTWHRHSVAV